jgi:uncharacterized membrane-anchored protein
VDRVTTRDLDRSLPATTRLPLLRHTATKVPQVTALFWIIKVLTTGMGEAAADDMGHRLGPVIAVGLAGTGLVAALVAQFAVRRYIAGVYWTAIVMVSVFGTMVADGLRLALGLSHSVNTAVFTVAVLAVFAVWYAVERTLSIHSIHTVRREFFYWATVMATFALGTAAGDWTAMTLGFGFLASGFLFTAVIAVPALAHRFAGLAAVPAFWGAYVVTRPLGASFADWMAVSPARGGLGWGTALVTIVMTAVIAVLVGYLAVTRRDVELAEN